MAKQLALWVEEVVLMPDWLVGSSDPLAVSFLADSVGAERGSFVDEAELVWDEDDYLADIA